MEVSLSNQPPRRRLPPHIAQPWLRPFRWSPSLSMHLPGGRWTVGSDLAGNSSCHGIHWDGLLGRPIANRTHTCDPSLAVLTSIRPSWSGDVSSNWTRAGDPSGPTCFNGRLAFPCGFRRWPIILAVEPGSVVASPFHQPAGSSSCS